MRFEKIKAANLIVKKDDYFESDAPSIRSLTNLSTSSVVPTF